MNVPSRAFSVGDVTLNKEVVNEQSLRELAQTAKNSGVKAGVQEVEEVVDQWLETGSIDQSQYEKIDGFARKAWGHHRKLNSEFWDRRRAGEDWKALKPLEQEMGKVGAFLTGSNKLRDQLRVDTALAAVTAAAGASFSGPVGLVAAYAAWANEAKWNGPADEATRELLDTFQGLLDGDSRMITENNKVQQVHREALWSAIGERLDAATASAEAGDPMVVGMQYYELTSPEVIGRAARTAEAGNKLRVNVDPGRLSYPEKDSSGNKFFDVDDIPDKLRAVIQLAAVKGDVGVSLFPAKQRLGNPENLMHRKVLQTGDQVLLSGMNANEGSGENLDAGYIIEGPAARALGGNLKRDLADSAGAGVEEIWGGDHYEGFTKETLKLTDRGLGAILDVLAGPSPAGTPLPEFTSTKELDELGKKAGVKPEELLDLQGQSYAEAVESMNRGGKVALSDEGKARLREVIERAVSVTQDPKNVERVNDVSLPSGRKAGETRVDIADLPSEREALLLNAVNEAEEFIYVPGFVVTRAVAAAIVARREALKEQGKELDVRVIADPGIYPDGNTPNRYGIKFLEDNGIVPRWALLTRTGWHDRKIHAKQLLTDKGEISGSTNFSKKGMRDNWEESTYVHFDPSDEEAMANREQAREQFVELWQNQTFELSSLDLAGYWNRYKPEVGREWAVEDSRDGAVRKIIGFIDEYEKQSGQWMASFLEAPAVRERYESLKEEGMAEGYALLTAVRDELGDRRYYEGLSRLPAYGELQELQQDVARWKQG